MHRVDRKLRRIRSTDVGRACGHEGVALLAKYADLIEFPAGAPIQKAGDHDAWSYLVIDGRAIMSRSGTPVAVVAPGSWVPGPDTHAGLTFDLTALTAVSLLAVGRRELRALHDDARTGRVFALALPVTHKHSTNAFGTPPQPAKDMRFDAVESREEGTVGDC